MILTFHLKFLLTVCSKKAKRLKKCSPEMPKTLQFDKLQSCLKPATRVQYYLAQRGLPVIVNNGSADIFFSKLFSYFMQIFFPVSDCEPNFSDIKEQT